MADLFVDKDAVFSPCRTWRYKLWRLWDTSRPAAMFLMLNPSTADETANDPTVERCERYAMSWGYGGLYVCNIFAYRATDPDVMKAATDPIGPDNDKAIIETASRAGIVVCAWGNHGSHMNRSENILKLLIESKVKPHCLAVTKTGEPGHPLYLKKNLKPIKYAKP